MVDHRAILLPLCAQVLLTLAVWIWLYITRIGTLLRKKVDVQDLADEAKSDRILKDVVNPSDNFENLFELPVLFYLACIVLYITGMTDSRYLGAAWVFVILRAVHSLIHCTYNRVMHRFTAYFIGSLVLWVMWIRITIQLLSWPGT